MIDWIAMAVPVVGMIVALVMIVVGRRNEKRRITRKVAALQEREAYASDAWADAGWTDDRYRRGPSYATVVDEGDDHPPF